MHPTGPKDNLFYNDSDSVLLVSSVLRGGSWRIWSYEAFFAISLSALASFIHPGSIDWLPVPWDGVTVLLASYDNTMPYVELILWCVG